MRESMEILSDPEMAARVRAGRRAVATADVVGLEQLADASPAPRGPWRVVVTGPVALQLGESDESAAKEVRETLVKLAAAPTEEGQALGMGLVGVWSARGASQRVLYAIQERERLVTVLTVDPG